MNSSSLPFSITATRVSSFSTLTTISRLILFLLSQLATLLTTVWMTDIFCSAFLELNYGLRVTWMNRFAWMWKSFFVDVSGFGGGGELFACRRQSSLWMLTLCTTPSAAMRTMRNVRPALMKGRGSPVMGMSPIDIATLT